MKRPRRPRPNSNIAFALLTPFFFLRAGTLISDSALVTGAGVIVTLFFEDVTKFSGVATAKAFKLPKKERTVYGRSLWRQTHVGPFPRCYGLTHHLINEAQYNGIGHRVSSCRPSTDAHRPTVLRPTVEVADETVEALGEEESRPSSSLGIGPGARVRDVVALRIQRDSRAGATSATRDIRTASRSSPRPNFCERPHRGGCPFSSAT